MTAWTMNAVSVAEPSVCTQLVSRGTLRKRKYLIPPISPERSSSQSSGYSAPPRSGRGAGSSSRRGRHYRRHLDRVEPGLGPVDVDARPARPYFMIRALGAGATRRCRRCRSCRARACRRGSRTRRDRASGRAGRRCGCPRCRTGRRGTGSRSRITRVGVSSTLCSPDRLLLRRRRRGRSAAPDSRGGRSARRGS